MASHRLKKHQLFEFEIGPMHYNVYDEHHVVEIRKINKKNEMVPKDAEYKISYHTFTTNSNDEVLSDENLLFSYLKKNDIKCIIEKLQNIINEQSA